VHNGVIIRSNFYAICGNFIEHKQMVPRITPARHLLPPGKIGDIACDEK
jgi:hypothetical protein